MIRFENGKYYIDGEAFIKLCAENHPVPAHTHDFIEINYVLKGKCIHTIDGKVYSAVHGDAVIINYGQTHLMETESGTEYINILIKPEMINESIKGTENAFSLLTLSDFEDFKNSVNRSDCFINFKGAERKDFEALVMNLISEQKESPPGATLMMRSGLNMILIYIFRKMSLPISESFSDIDSSLLEYIKNNCDKKITLSEISKLCGYEKSYFSRLFKKKCSVTFTKFIRDCRIIKAKEFLESTDLSVEEIIEKSGFTDRSKFFSEFEKSVGCSPLKYRKSQKSILF